MKKLDNFWLSLSIGAILPLVFSRLFVASFYKGSLPIFEALKVMIAGSPIMISKLILVALVPNLFAVFICYSQQWWKAARGFFVPVLFYLAIAMFFL